MRKGRTYSGVWSNGKKVIDLDNLNSQYEMDEINNMILNSTNHSHREIYATASGTIIQTYQYDQLDDWYCDIGAMYNRETIYTIVGRNFKKIKDKGVLDEDFQNFLASMR